MSGNALASVIPSVVADGPAGGCRALDVRVYRGIDRLDAFGGGLVTTCGLRNVGAPSEGHGLHGTYSHLRARDVTVERAPDEIRASARIVDASATGHRLEVEREVSTRIGDGRVTISDTTRNLGPDPEPAPLLYNVNVGPPLWSEGARVEIDATQVVPRDEDARAGVATWDEAPPLEPGAPERAFEHVGATSAAVTNGPLRLEVRPTLPRLWLR